jgi:hypothetical protein
MKKFLYSLLAMLLLHVSHAAFTPFKPVDNNQLSFGSSGGSAPLSSNNASTEKEGPVETLTLPATAAAFEQATGKKLTRLQKWQYNRLQKRIARGQMGILPYREELSEGFQALPFFGTLLTGGLVALIMVFTARDRNAMRWAGLGITVLGMIITVATLVVGLSAY